MASEFARLQLNAGRRRGLYYFRDQQGLEVDFVVPTRGGSLALIECKASRTVTPSMAAPLLKLGESIRPKRPARSRLDMYIAHQAPKAGSPTHAVAPGVRAMTLPQLLEQLDTRR